MGINSSRASICGVSHKRGHWSRRQASRSYAKRHFAGVHPYKCGACGLWHLGHNQKKSRSWNRAIHQHDDTTLYTDPESFGLELVEALPTSGGIIGLWALEERLLCGWEENLDRHTPFLGASIDDLIEVKDTSQIEFIIDEYFPTTTDTDREWFVRSVADLLTDADSWQC